MIDTQQTKERGVEIADVYRVFDDVVAKVIGLAVRDSGVRTASRKPDCEASRMMVPSIIRFGEAALTIDGTAELPAPNHQRIVKHSSALQVGYQGIAGAVGCSTKFRKIANSIAVNVPPPLIDLGKPHASLGHPPGEQAIVGKAAGLPGFVTIKLPGTRRLSAHVGQFGYRGLHTKRHFILLNARMRFRVTDFLVRHLVDGLDAVHHGSASLARHAVRVLEVQHWLPLGAKLNSRVFIGEKTAAPQLGGNRLHVRALDGGRIQHNKGGQILIHAAQTICEPRTKRRFARHHIAGVHQQVRRFMVDRIGVKRMNYREIVRHLRGEGQNLGNPASAFPRSHKSKMSRRNRKTRLSRGHACEHLGAANRIGQVLVVKIRQVRLVIPQIHLRGRARHK